MKHSEQVILSLACMLFSTYTTYMIADDLNNNICHIEIAEQGDEMVSLVDTDSFGNISSDRSVAITGPITITQSGSYYLDNDVTGKITISATRVMLDLKGHTVASTSDSGIEISSASCVVIKNGFIASGSYYSHHGCVRCVASSNVLCSELMCIPSLSANGFVVGDSSDIILTKCKISAQGPSNLSGISLEKVYKVTVDHCDIYGFYNGIYFSPVPSSSHVSIQHNHIFNSGFYGIQMRASTGSVVRHNLIKNNVKGIWIVSGSTKTLVFGNVIKDCTGTASSEPALYDQGTLSKIYGNIAQDNVGGYNYSASIPLQIAEMSVGAGMYANINW